MVQFTWILVLLAINAVNSEASQNGEDVSITDHPYMVSIRKNNVHYCSGVIIHKDYIVTSDRCVPSLKHSWNIMNDLTIVSGTSTTQIGGQLNFVKETFSQNHYINPSKNPVISGIGVIKLGIPLQFGNSQSIELSPTNVPAGAKLQMIGWRIKNNEGKESLNLKKVNLKATDRKECQQFYEKNLTNSEFCTVPEHPYDFCEGDSGSILICDGKFVGVANYGISCAEPEVIPDVHTNMNEMCEYLKNIVGK